MADNIKITGKPEREKVSVAHELEVEDWARQFGVTPSELRRAVKEVGDNPKVVEAFLEKAKH